VKRVFTFRGCFGGLGEQTEDEVSNEQQAGQDIFTKLSTCCPLAEKSEKCKG
jgi:hypothetical protein